MQVSVQVPATLPCQRFLESTLTVQLREHLLMLSYTMKFPEIFWSVSKSQIRYKMAKASQQLQIEKMMDIVRHVTSMTILEGTVNVAY